MNEQTPKDLFIHRPATIIDKNSVISKDPFEEDTFVVFNGQVAIGGSRITHARAALNSGLYDQLLTKKSDSPIVDDGGQIFDNGNELVIGSYFTSSTRPKLINEAIHKSEDIDMNEVKKIIRRNTGQLLANIMGRNVVVKHKDNTEDKFFPQG